MLAATDVAGVAAAVLAVRGGRRFSFSLSPLFFFCFLLCFFLSLLCLLSSLLSIFSLSSPFYSLPPLLVFSSFFFLSALPCIYRKTGEGDMLGWPPLPFNG